MRVAVPVLALTAAVSSASAALLSRQSLPNCAVPCLANANTTGCSSAQDDTCLCKDQTFINSTTTCILQSCSGSDLANAEAFAQQLCLAVGVTLTAPTPASTASGSGPAAPTPSTKNGASLTGTFSVLAAAVAALAAAAIL